MAVRPYQAVLLILILLIAGIGGYYISRSRQSRLYNKEIDRFISTYTGLSFVGERFASSPDSLAVARDSVYRANNTDSAWVYSFAFQLSHDIQGSSYAWNEIMKRLNILRDPGHSDTLEID